MPKKKTKTTKQSTSQKSRQSSAGSSTAKPASRKSPPQRDEHQHCQHEQEIELDSLERKAIDLVRKSNAMCEALEAEVNKVVTQAVRKVYKTRGVSLTAVQAQNVAMVLFGD